MNSSLEDFSNYKVEKLSTSNKATTLNPNAAEYIPVICRSTSRNTSSAETTRFNFPRDFARPKLDRSASSVSGNSEDEPYQYWDRQIPGKITLDFKVAEENELHASEHMSFADLSIHDGMDSSRFNASLTSEVLGKQQNVSSHGNLRLNEKMGVLSSSYAEDQSDAFPDLAAISCHQQLIKGGKSFPLRREEYRYSGDSGYTSPNDLRKHTVLDDVSISPLDFLASQFPGLSVESLAEVFCATGCNMDLAIECLTELQLRGDGGLRHNLKSKASVASSFGVSHFPVSPVANAQNGLSRYNGNEFQHSQRRYKTLSSTSRDIIDNAAAVRKLTFQGSCPWNSERNVSADGYSCSSRRSQPLANSYSYRSRQGYGDKLQNSDMLLAASVWPEIKEALANIPLEAREGHDLASLRNECLRKVSGAYSLGDKELATELGAKVQSLDMHTKSSFQKAKETTYRQRNTVSHELQDYGRSQDQLIDLHGLHVNEAIPILVHKLSTIRTRARYIGQRLPAIIYTGTGQQTRSPCSPGRLVTAVKQYLLEEGLNYTQPQPDQLHVVVY